MAAKKILWVEDDRELVSALLPRLRQEGWEVATASCAGDGMAMMRSEKPDLIIMDVIMPEEHGFSAIETLKSGEEASGIPVVVYSNLPGRWGETTATREDMLCSEAAVFIDKSGGAAALIDAVREILE